MTSESTKRDDPLEQIRATRGYVLPGHELLAAVDPDLLRRYDELAGYLLFGEEERALDMKTRFLVLLGITTAVKQDKAGIEWSMKRAQEHGATERECLEAIALAALPAGMPTVEFAANAWKQSQEEAIVPGAGQPDDGTDD